MSDIEFDYAMARHHRRVQGDALTDDLASNLRRLGHKAGADQITSMVVQWLARILSYR